MIYPIQEVPLKRVQQIKDATKRKLLEKATNGWKKPVTDFVFREAVMGDSTCTDVYDIQPDSGNELAAATPFWGFDAASLTLDDGLYRITYSAKEIDDNKWIGFYGFSDISGEAGEKTGAAKNPVPSGQIMAIEFKRGSSVLDLWNTEHLYAYDEVVGITDTPVIYEESEMYEILVNASEYEEDKFAVIRGYVCEPIGLGHFNPTMSRNVDARAEHGVTSVNMLSQEQQIQSVIRGGMDPVQEMTPEQIMRLYDRAKAGLYSMIVNAGDATSVQDARRNYYIRPLCAGDKTGTQHDTYVDVDEDIQGGGYADEEHWWQDAANVSNAGDLTGMILTGQTIDDKKYVAVFGLADRGANSTLLQVAPGDQGGNLDFSDVQHLYGYHDQVKGYTQRITYYASNAPFGYKMSFSATDIDNFVMVNALIAEPYGHVVSHT